MTKIERIEVTLVSLAPEVVRTDAIQSFVKQETPILRLFCSDGSEGIGYTYTIGTGGSSIMALLQDHLVPMLLGRDPDCIESIWRDLLFHTHATHVGAITSLALAAIDTALWDRKCRVAGQPLWKMAGGAKSAVPVYTTEGGWLHLETAQLVEQAQLAQQAQFSGAKVKVGKPRLQEDVKRLSAVRDAVGQDFELMVDANQAFTLSEAIRRARAYDGLNLAWFEEPMPADNIREHAILSAQSSTPIAVGESMYSAGQFADYLGMRACHIVQVDVARIGGITPWLKVAHMAECQNVSVCPHFLMELHVSLSCAVPNAPWVEYIPQLDQIATSRLQIQNGLAQAPQVPGLGISWNLEKIDQMKLSSFTAAAGHKSS